MRTSSGKPVRLLILFGYSGRLGSDFYQQEFYKEVARKYDIPYMDLVPALNALHVSYFPITGDGAHFNPDGAMFFGKLLTHELVREKLIPWKEDPEK
jgi:lysophospholipase L1-like esterase